MNRFILFLLSVCFLLFSCGESNQPRDIKIDRGLEGAWTIESMRITGRPVPPADSLFTAGLGRVIFDPCQNSRKDRCKGLRILPDGREFEVKFQVTSEKVDGDYETSLYFSTSGAPERKYEWVGHFQIDELTDEVLQFSCKNCASANQWGGTDIVVRAVKEL